MINWIRWILAGVVTLTAIIASGLYLTLYLSLPSLDGNNSTYHVNSPTELQRDALGHAVIQADGINDAAYALGFAHAQDRFFQMDLQRRSASGNLSQWVGDIAIERDKSARFHQFSKRAQVVFAALPQNQKTLLIHYAHGVNEALKEFTVPPFEYLAAGVEIEQWRPTDSILVVYSMYLDLQSSQVDFDLTRTALLDTFGEEIYHFITQPSTFQAALDGSKIPLLNADIPPFPAALTKINADTIVYTGIELPDIGSNNWAVTGKLTATGAGMLANDMHLGLRVPVIWYRTQLNYSVAGEEVSVTGVSLPGLPGIVVGTNNHIAWGFTNSNLDNVDWIELQPSTPTTMVTESIPLPNGKHEFELEVSEFGPVKQINGKKFALNWVAHHPFAVNLNIVDLGPTTTLEQAMSVIKHIAIPTQNVVLVDKNGGAAWLPGGAVLERENASFTAITEPQYRDNPPKRMATLPSVVNPESNRIWTANARVISTADFERLGDGGYALGARGQQIRDRLYEKDRFSETDFYAIQLDNQAQFLMPWHDLLYGLLSTQDIEFKPDLAYLNTWGACACEDSVGYTLAKHFRQEVVQTLFGRILSQLDAQDVNSRTLLRGIESATWQLIHQQPDGWLTRDASSYDELLLDAYRRAKHKLLDKFSPVEADMEQLRWGNVNMLAVNHPFASQIPIVGSLLNMDAVEGFGDTYMPAVQAPRFGASERFFVSPGHLEDAILTLPGGQSGHPLSHFFDAGFRDYATHAATPLLPSEIIHSRTFYTKEEQ